MSEATVRPGGARRPTRRPTARANGSASRPGSDAARARIASELTALVRLAELDEALLARGAQMHPASYDEVADERHGLGARISAPVLEAYERAVRGGRRPAVVRAESGVCSGCHVRLHATLDQVIRRVRGAAACPHCLRLVYDPAWLRP